jgi:hypothetical protein
VGVTVKGITRGRASHSTSRPSVRTWDLGPADPASTVVGYRKRILLPRRRIAVRLNFEGTIRALRGESRTSVIRVLEGR